MTQLFKAITVGSAALLLNACAATHTAPEPAPTMAHQLSREVAMQAYTEGDYHLAEGLLQRLAEPPYLDPQAPCFLGAIHYRRHAYTAALTRFKECTRHYPERGEAWFNAAAAHLRLATELLLTGRSYQSKEAGQSMLSAHYESLLETLLHLQRAHTSEVN